jgi:hypothetical protein
MALCDISAQTESSPVKVNLDMVRVSGVDMIRFLSENRRGYDMVCLRKKVMDMVQYTSLSVFPFLRPLSLRHDWKICQCIARDP